MSFEIQTTSSFDAEAKRLAKRHRSLNPAVASDTPATSMAMAE